MKIIKFKEKYLPQEFIYPKENKIILIKGDTGLGGTTLFLKDNKVNNIIITPNISQIISKENDKFDKKVFFIYHNSKDRWEDVKSYKKDCNIYTTYKQLNICKSLNIYQTLILSHRLVIDEYHSLITKDYMGVTPYIYNSIDDFKKVILTSATYIDLFINPTLYNLPIHKWERVSPRNKLLHIKKDFNKQEVIAHVIDKVNKGEHILVFSNDLNKHTTWFNPSQVENIVGDILKSKIIRYKDNVNDIFDYSKQIHIISAKGYEGMDFLEDTNVLFLNEIRPLKTHLSKGLLDIAQGYGRGRGIILDATYMYKSSDRTRISEWDVSILELEREVHRSRLEKENKLLSKGNINIKNFIQNNRVKNSISIIESELYKNYSLYNTIDSPYKGMKSIDFETKRYKDLEIIIEDNDEVRSNFKQRVLRYNTLEDKDKVDWNNYDQDLYTTFNKTGIFTKDYFMSALLSELIEGLGITKNIEDLKDNSNTTTKVGLYKWMINYIHSLGYGTDNVNIEQRFITRFINKNNINKNKNIHRDVEDKIMIFTLLYYSRYLPKEFADKDFIESLSDLDYDKSVFRFKSTLEYLSINILYSSVIGTKMRGNRDFNPLTTLPKKLRLYIPIKMLELDFKKFNPTFLGNVFKLGNQDNFLNKVDNIYNFGNDSEFKNKIKVNRLLNSNKDKNRILDIEGLKSIGMNAIEIKIFNLAYFNNRGLFYTDTTRLEKRLIDKLKDQIPKGSVRLHDALFVLNQKDILDIEEVDNYKLKQKLYS